MKEEKHYCDRCKKEIKYFYLYGGCFPYLTVNENTYDDLVKNDKSGVLLKHKCDDYELCHKCKRDFKKFMKGQSIC